MEARYGYQGYKRTLFYTTSVNSAKEILESKFFKQSISGGIYLADSLKAIK